MPPRDRIELTGKRAIDAYTRAGACASTYLADDDSANDDVPIETLARRCDRKRDESAPMLAVGGGVVSACVHMR